MKTSTIQLSGSFPARYVGSEFPENLHGRFVPAGRGLAEVDDSTFDQQAKSRETVVLVGPADWPQNVYLAEAVFKSGFSVEFVSTDRLLPKALQWIRLREVPSFDPDVLADLMCSYEEDDRVRWIIPIAEDAIWAVRALLPDSVKVFSRLSTENAAVLSSKQSMRVFAEALGITVPQEFPIASLSEAVLASRSLGFPCVLKGEGGCGGAQVAVCRNDQDLNQGWARLQSKHPSLQSFISGNPWAAGGFFVNGQPIRVHLYEKLAQSPPGVGPPTRIRHDSPRELKEALLMITRAMKWTGFLQVDFIRAANGQFYFLEINPRPWGSMTAVNAGGSDIFSPFVDVLWSRTPVPDLENHDGWSGYVFPKPVLSQSFNGNLVSVLRTILSLRFWRSIPKGHSLTTRMYFEEILHPRKLYWGLSRRSSRSASSVFRKVQA